MGAGRLEEAHAALVGCLLADMEADPVNWVRSWNADMPRNAATGAHYRGRNALLLSFCMRERGLDDPRFMTFNQARAAGFSDGPVVRKGSHSFPIEKWKPVYYRVTESGRERVRAPRDDAERAALEADPLVHRTLALVGYFSVFNAADIVGIPPYEPPRRLEGGEVVDFLEGHSPCPVVEAAGCGEAYYDRLADEITLPSRDAFDSELAMSRVLLHEQGHATGAPSRLDREKGAVFGDEAYAREELVAELASLFTANELGLRIPEVSTDEVERSAYWGNHVAYVRSWSSRLDDPVKAVFQAAARAGEASSYLMEKCFGPALDAAERAADAPEAAVESLGAAARALAAARHPTGRARTAARGA